MSSVLRALLRLVLPGLIRVGRFRAVAALLSLRGLVMLFGGGVLLRGMVALFGGTLVRRVALMIGVLMLPLRCGIGSTSHSVSLVILLMRPIENLALSGYRLVLAPSSILMAFRAATGMVRLHSRDLIILWRVEVLLLLRLKLFIIVLLPPVRQGLLSLLKLLGSW